MSNDQDTPYRATPNSEIMNVEDLAAFEDDGHELNGRDPVADNVRRAAFAAQAVVAYAEAVNGFSNDIETVISDMLGDLQHLTDMLTDSEGVGGEFPTVEALLDRGSVHYEAEIRGEL